MILDRNIQYQAYNMASQTVPKTRQIVMLYDGAIRFIKQAKEAIEQNRVQDRFNLLVKASDVVVSLQNCLDHESGGDIAKVLHDFYSSIDMSILSIHRTNSLEMCDKVIENLKQMRSAWSQIDAQGQIFTGPDNSDAELAMSSLQPLVTSDMTIPQPTATPAAFTPPEGGLQVSA